MKLTTELARDTDTWTLKLIGNVSAATAHSLWYVDSSATLLRQLKEAQAETLVLDLSETNSIDSHALRLLLNAQREFSRENVHIVLRHPNEHLSRLFRVMQFDRIFEVQS